MAAVCENPSHPQAGCLPAAAVIAVNADCSPLQVALANVAVSMSGLATGLFISAASRPDAVATHCTVWALATHPQRERGITPMRQ